MKVYISESEAKARFGTKEPKELIGRKIKSPYGEPWRIRKAELLGNVAEDGTFEIKLELS